MANFFKPPTPVPWNNKPSVFLAGTIENGDSEDWQTTVEDALSGFDISVLNPRRDEWDASWEQSIDNPKFREQVEWELDGLERATHIFMVFAENSRSPVTLLELGLHAHTDKLIIVCPAGFWRRGNIEVVAERYRISLLDTLEAGIARLQTQLATNK